MKDPKGPPCYPINFTECRCRDVIHERGGKANRHPGNRTLLQIVSNCKSWYKNLSKSERLIVVNYLMKWLSTDRKFVVRIRDGAPWMEASAAASRLKVLHMLRDKNTKPQSKDAKQHRAHSASELHRKVLEAISSETLVENGSQLMPKPPEHSPAVMPFSLPIVSPATSPVKNTIMLEPDPLHEFPLLDFSSYSPRDFDLLENDQFPFFSLTHEMTLSVDPSATTMADHGSTELKDFTEL